MGNRHHHKKLRAEVRARMARTGESYQRALERIRSEGALPNRVDLLPVAYFGAEATLATYEIAGRLACIVLSGGARRGPFPENPLVALAMRGPRIVH